MWNWIKKMRPVIFLILFILLLLYPSLQWTKNSTHSLSLRYNSKLSPIIMIPGSSANVNRFDDMVETINKESIKKHSLIKVTVLENDTVTMHGDLLKDDKEPFIVVGFENNKDGYNNILKQAKWFDIAFDQLQLKYHFNHFKAIGHSNGGLIYTAFLENYFSNYEKHIDLTKMMTIGTPYNFGENSMNHKTQMLADFIKKRNNIPKNISMYSVIGTKNYTSDGIVPEESVEAGKYIYQDHVKQFTEITVTGSNAQHSALPQSDEIIDLIRRYIMEKPKQNENKLNTIDNENNTERVLRNE